MKSINLYFERMENVPEKDQTTGTTGNLKKRSWLKRIGIAGFLFFMLKGIGWLVLIYLLREGLVDESSWVYKIFH